MSEIKDKITTIKINQIEETALSHCEQAKNYLLQNEHKKSIECYTKASECYGNKYPLHAAECLIKILDIEKDPHKFRCVSEKIADIYLSTNKYEQANNYYQQSLKCSIKDPNYSEHDALKIMKKICHTNILNEDYERLTELYFITAELEENLNICSIKTLIKALITQIINDTNISFNRCLEISKVFEKSEQYKDVKLLFEAYKNDNVNVYHACCTKLKKYFVSDDDLTCLLLRMKHDMACFYSQKNH